MVLRVTLVLLAVLVAGSSYLAAPALVLGSDSVARSLACVPARSCVPATSCDAPLDDEGPRTPCSDAADDDAFPRGRCMLVVMSALVLEVHLEIPGGSTSESPAMTPRHVSRTPAPETPPPRRSIVFA